MRHALVMHTSDSVATALTPLKNGELITVADQNAGSFQFQVNADIPYGHKFALRKIEKGEPVIKYGEVIGVAKITIENGGYVHVHNVESQRGRGDRG